MLLSNLLPCWTRQNFNTMLNRNDESKHLYLLLISGGGIIQYFIIKYNVSSSLFIASLYQKKENAFIYSLLRVFNIHDCWVLPNDFPAFIEIIIFFLIYSINVVNYTTFQISKAMPFWDKLYFTKMCYLFNILLVLMC